MSENPATLFEIMGGEAAIRRLVDVFYAKVEADEVLRAIFPEDLSPGKEYQYLFLIQYWGGIPSYSMERGHPRLRMRHAPYAITLDLRNRWAQYMLEAIDEVGIPEPARGQMREYFEQGATFMINRYE